MEKTLLARVNNEVDVLMRVTGLVRRKGFHMKSISMEESTPEDAYLKIVLKYNENSIDNLVSQIQKCVDVYNVKVVEQ